MQPLPGVWGRSPLRRGVLNTPHRWPRQGTGTGDGVEGRYPVCRGVLHTPHKWPRQGTDAGRRVPSLVPDGSSEGRMQYAPTAYRKKRPFLPIYLGASRREKEKGGPSAIPACRGVLHTPPKWPRQGTNAGRRVPSFLLLIEEKKAKEDQGLCRG